MPTQSNELLHPNQYPREALDAYDTIDRCLKMSLHFILPGDVEIWECAAGRNCLTDSIRSLPGNRRVICASDIAPRRAGIIQHDFLKDPVPPIIIPNHWALTNPPFHKGAVSKFAERMIELIAAGHLEAAVLLVRHDHLQAKGRVDLLNMADLVIAPNVRPKWYAPEAGRTSQPMWTYRWVRWTKASIAQPGNCRFRWIDQQEVPWSEFY